MSPFDVWLGRRVVAIERTARKNDLSINFLEISTSTLHFLTYGVGCFRGIETDIKLRGHTVIRNDNLHLGTVRGNYIAGQVKNNTPRPFLSI